MPTPIDGIMPVMLTPFTDDNAIDRAGAERLVEWHLDHGADALFAVCCRTTNSRRVSTRAASSF